MATRARRKTANSSAVVAAAPVTVKPLQIGTIQPLPDFAPETPVFIEYSNETTNTIALARALLQADVLREDDWQGHLSVSIEKGVERWLYELGVGQLQHFNLSFGYTDNVMNSPSFLSDWTVSVDKEELGPAGMFALKHDPYTDLPGVAVGNRVLDLEEIAPGAGYGLLRIVCSAIRYTVNAMTPWDALEHCQNQYEMLIESFEFGPEESEPPRDENGQVLQSYIEERTGRLSPEGLKESLPKQIFEYKKASRAPLKRALRHLGSIHRDDVEGMLLSLGLRLFDVMDAKEKKFKNSPPHAVYFEGNPVLATMVHWASINEQDGITRAADEFLEELSQMQDYATDIVWFTSFYTRDPVSVTHSVEQVRSCIEILVLLDNILRMLHSDEPLRKPVCKPKPGKPLAQIFREEQITDNEAFVEEL